MKENNAIQAKEYLTIPRENGLQKCVIKVIQRKEMRKTIVIGEGSG
jgi:hypothetical protein